MNSRYLTNVTLAGMGAFLVVGSFAWGVPVYMWIMLGIGVLSLALCTSSVLPRRGLVQRGLDGTIAILAAWTIVASQVFSGLTVTWLGFASGCAFFGLAVAGLTLHELRAERVVHSFAVRSPDAEHELAGIN